MSRPPDRGGGHPPGLGAAHGKSYATTAWAVGWSDASEVRMRTFAEIIASEKTERNILDIHVTKIFTAENNTKPKNLTFDELGEFIFDISNIKQEECQVWS